MMKNWLSRAVCLAAVLFCAAGCTHERIVISEVPVSEGFVGNGVEWSAYPHADSEEAEWGYLMTDEKLRRVFERLDYMKPRIVRIMDVAAWRYYKGVDAQGEPLLDFACDEVRMVCRLLEYCQSRGITVLIGDYGVPGFWGYAGGIDRVDDPRYIDMTTRYLTYLKRERGFDCIRYYIITNEPNGDWACTRGDWEQWKRGIALMHASFERAGSRHRASPLRMPSRCPKIQHRNTPPAANGSSKPSRRWIRSWINTTSTAMPTGPLSATGVSSGISSRWRGLSGRRAKR